MTQRKFKSSAQELGGASVAHQVYQLALLVARSLPIMHLDPAKQCDIFGWFLKLPQSLVLICIVEYVAEGCSKSAVKLDFCLVFGAAGEVYVGVDEGLHGVNVEDVLSDLVLGVG